MKTSIVIPSYNRPDRLRSCLEALSSLDGGPYETIVVDDGSDTSLAPVCEGLGDHVRCVRQENAGPARARNLGAKAASGDFLAFTDDDCRPEPGWVRALCDAHAGHKDRLIGGRVENILTGNVYSAASQSLCDFLYEYFDAAGGQAEFFTSNNIGCSRERFFEIGGFDEAFPLAAAEDRDFGMRWRDTGGALCYAPEAVVGHAHLLTLNRFLRQHVNYGRGARHLHKVIDRRGSDQPRMQKLDFYFRLMTHPLRAGEARALPQSALLVASQLAMIWGYYLSPPR